MREREARQHGGADAHLRSAPEIVGYHVSKRRDGPIGHIEDLLFDEESWAIRYVVMNTRNWLPGKRSIISLGASPRPSWTGHPIWVDPTRDQETTRPEF